jgi:hypothetical protein
MNNYRMAERRERNSEEGRAGDKNNYLIKCYV